MGSRDSFTVEQDDESGKWFVVDLRERMPHRFPTPFGSSAMAINVMDRFIAHLDGAPLADIEEMRAEADKELRTLLS